MKAIGIYGSPRKGGNSDVLLDRTLEGAESAGAEIIRIYLRDLDYKMCQGCGACLKTGQCIQKDLMQEFYPKLLEAEVIFLATPIYFYGVSAQAKMFIDRCQALWSRRMLEKQTEQDRKQYDGGRGYLVAVGASQGKKLFLGVELTAKYFFDALDKSYEGGVLARGADAKGDILDQPEVLAQARELGLVAVAQIPGAESPGLGSSTS